jgi:hypothetical protein
MVPTGAEVATLTLHGAEGLDEGAPKLGSPDGHLFPARRRRAELLAWPECRQDSDGRYRHRGKAGCQRRYYEELMAGLTNARSAGCSR